MNAETERMFEEQHAPEHRMPWCQRSRNEILSRDILVVAVHLTHLLKDMEPDELVLALRDIVNGKTVVAPDLAPILARAVQGKSPEVKEESDSPFSDLTPRETEILGLLAEGQSNKAIARNLGISDGTVKLHVKAILRKLNVHSRVEAAVMAVEKGLSKNQL